MVSTKGLSLKRYFFFCTHELTQCRFYVLATCSYSPVTYKGQPLVKITYISTPFHALV